LYGLIQFLTDYSYSQQFAGLRATGQLDSETVDLLSRRRCGLPDVGDRGYRSKRYAVQGQKWEKLNLNWT
jgi:hypothetical protein